MNTSQVLQYGLRVIYSQPSYRDKIMARSAYALAAIGLGLSSFSVHQMITQPRQYKNNV